jgi:hypothetical protein
MKTIASVFGFLLASTAVASAAPFPMTSTTPPTGAAYSYKAEGSGGAGVVDYSVPTIPAGVYVASWDASFLSIASAAAPVDFGCFLTQLSGDTGTIVGESTTVDIGGYFDPSTSGSISVKVASGNVFFIACGAGNGGNWKWGAFPLQVTFTRLQTRTSGPLGGEVIGPESGIRQSSQSGK